MINILPFYLVAMILYAVGEYYSKIYASHSSSRLFALIIVIYSLSAAAWLPAINRLSTLTIIGTIWNVSYFIITLFLGLVVFKETITSLHMVGVLFGVISVTLLSI
jgi:hypothetical protein